MKKRFTQLIATGVLALLPAVANAAGARITWSDVQETAHYKLFVAQPDGFGTRVVKFRINNPRKTENGFYYYDVHGIDPVLPTYILMIGVDWRGVFSAQSNMVELGSDSFCEIFDVDGNRKVDASDALAVARKALGLTHGRVKVKG